MDAGQQVTGMGAEDGIAEGRHHAEIAAGRGVILEQEGGHAIVVVCQPQELAVLGDQRVFQERGHGGERASLGW